MALNLHHLLEAAQPYIASQLEAEKQLPSSGGYLVLSAELVDVSW